MNIYVDSSALVKMVIEEADSPALGRYFAEFSLDRQLTAAISRTELVRAVARRGATVENARKALSKLDFVAITNSLLDDAARLRHRSCARSTRSTSLPPCPFLICGPW